MDIISSISPEYTMSFGYFLSTIFSGQNLAILGAFLAAALAGCGSAKGVGMVAQSAAVCCPRAICSVSCCFMSRFRTQGIYGLITAFLIMVKIGLIGTPVNITTSQGAYMLIAALPIAIVGYVSAQFQARACVAGVNLLAKQKNEIGKAITNAALVETYAILALLVSLLLIIFFKV